MITVLAIMTAGIVLGIFLQKKKKLIQINDKLTMWAIYLLLFLLGISVGSNDTIMQNLDTIGVKALIITAGSLIGSILAAWFVYVKFFKNKEQLNEK